MNKTYHYIASLDELRHARIENEQKLIEIKYEVKNCWDATIDNITPSNIITSSLGGIVSLVSEFSFLKKGSSMLLSLIEGLKPHEEAASDKAPEATSPLNDKEEKYLKNHTT